jgi:hypothetical protein
MRASVAGQGAVEPKKPRTSGLGLLDHRCPCGIGSVVLLSLHVEFGQFLLPAPRKFDDELGAS